MQKIIYFLSLLLTAYSYGQLSDKEERKAIEKQINLAGERFKSARYDQALSLSKQALVRSFKIEDDYLIAHAYNSIAVIYDEFSESKRAIEFYQKAMQHADNIENDSLKDWIYSNLGSAYYFNKIDVKKGIGYYQKSLEFAQKINDSAQITYTKLNIASAYFSINDFEKGYRYVQEVAPYISRKGQQEAKLSLYTLKGIYHSNFNQPKLAEGFFDQAVAIGQQNHMESFLLNTYQNLYQHFQRYKDQKREKLYRSKYEALNQKLYPEENRKDLDNAAIQIELDENKNQLEKIELAYERQQKKIKDSKTISSLFSIILLVLLILIYTLYKNNNSRKKLNAELTLANAELKIAKEKAEEISHLKTQFVSTISHELRTPLYGVIGITDLFLEEHKELVSNEHLHSLKFSARYLLALVNDILQINKMEEKKIVLEKATFSLSAELQTIINSLQFIASKNDNALKLSYDPEIPEFLLGDALRLSQILVNLVSNALKFTRKGEVTVGARLEKIVGNTHFICFEVRDNGIGIAKGDQEKIFEKFVQIERKDGDYQGTGLGLTIVKRLIELFKSEIHLESGPDHGTVFSFTIGFEKDDSLSKAMVAEMKKETVSENLLRILVVEDNKINQMVTKRIIERNQHQCVVAENGYEAIDLLRQEPFDVILMDINMPMINGYETSRKIREMGIGTPIIALTAFDKNEVEPQALVSGIDGIIIKPFEPVELFEMIQSTMNS